jgi:hypothetical protein
MRLLYKNITAFQQDDCINSALMEIASAPLTTFYAHQKMGLEFKEQMVIHFVGELNIKECCRPSIIIT